MTESLSNVFVPSSIDRSVVRFVGPHRGGFVSYKRLFGGQTAAQIFKVGKLLNRGNVVHTVKAHYVAPGSVTDPIDYHVTEILGTNFMIINGTQNGKHIVSGKVMFGAKEDLLELPAHRFPDVLSPLQYPAMSEHLHTYKDTSPWKMITAMSRSFFEIRPIDFAHISFQSSDDKPFRAWFTVAPEFRDHMDKADGEMVVIMMSDHIVTTSAFITLIQKGYESIMEQSASLSHIVLFHEVENIDPLGWFLYESTCDKQASARYIIDARIYDQRGRCILSSVQEGLVQKKAK